MVTSNGMYGVRDWRTFTDRSRTPRPARVAAGPVRRRYASAEWAQLAAVRRCLPVSTVETPAPELGSRQSWEEVIVARCDTETPKPIMTARDIRPPVVRSSDGASNNGAADRRGDVMRRHVDDTYETTSGRRPVRAGARNALISHRSKDPRPTSDPAVMLARLMLR
jgi:hypothetical protein